MEIQFPKLCPKISPNTKLCRFPSQFLHLEVVLQVAANSWQVVHALDPHLANVQQLTMVINILINILTNSISTWQIFHHDHQHIVANISVG